MPMYPVWIHDKKTPRPVGPILYEISANGVFLHKETPFWKAIVPVRRIGILEEQKPRFELLLPPIPKRITKTVAQFFAWVTQKHNTEALALLWWNEQGLGAYSVTVPIQKVAFGRVEYDIPQRSGYRLIGTLHSHGPLPAFHSTVDHHDEINFDGIHGTFGGFFSSSDKNKFDLSLQAGINEIRFILEPWIWMVGVDKIEPKIPPPMEQPDLGEQFYQITSELPVRAKDNAKEYKLSNGEELLPKSYRPPPKWLENIEFIKFWKFNMDRADKSPNKTWPRSKEPKSILEETK
jgi:hypothetical protein